MDEKNYELKPDLTLPLSKKKYDCKLDADTRMATICAEHNYILLDELTTETEAYYVYHVLRRKYCRCERRPKGILACNPPMCAHCGLEPRGL